MYDLIRANFALHINLTATEEQQIFALLQQRQVAKKSVLVRAGEIQRHIYFVQQGCLRMYYTDNDGLEHNLGFYPENWWACDNMSFFKSKPASNSIQALEDSELCYFSLSDLEKLFTEVPKLERFFRILTQNGYDIFQRRITSIFSKTAGQRYKEFRKRYPGLEQRIAQKQIASYLGITAAFLSMIRNK